MNLPVLGIDIAKLKFNICLLKPGEKPKHKAFANNLQGFEQLTEWLIKHNGKDVHACLEATGIYGEALALFLVRAGYPGERRKSGSRQSICRSRTLPHENRQS
jgi:transposase